MKKVFMFLACLMFAITLHAVKKGRPVRLGQLGVRTGLPKSIRAPAKEPVSLYQENDILHVNAEAELMMTVTLKDEEGNILSQVMLTSPECDIEIPDNASIVEVSYNDVSLVGMLY